MDTAHAYVNADTVREPLYVMATRGRESNRLYVDTCPAPDTSTLHNDATGADALELLEGVIRTSGADLSATTTRQAEEEAAHAEWRLVAEGAAVAARHRVASSVSSFGDGPHLINGPVP